ncbi:protein Ycf2-like [Cucumis melo var. makuwa]|uniref:Protein Ycf2-like n=2 Tax=Cucumis melo TaxID=3656 RepID=A0A5D3E3X1_CUCMM|nr:protein Ycf2-like [Cucumis melo var. makuwa]
MVRRSERCLGSRLKKIKSSKDNSILIEDNVEEDIRNEEPLDYQPIQIIYPKDDEEELQGPTGTQIVVYDDKKFMRTDMVFKTPEAKMPKKKEGKQNNEEQTLHVLENFSSKSDEDNVPIARRKLFETVLKGKGKETAAENGAPLILKRSQWFYECIPLLTGPSIICAQKVDDNKICMLNWVVDNHPEWKDLAEKVFDNDQFKFEVMFEEDFVERMMFHENVMREETNGTFERGESSWQGETSNEKIPDYFLKFQELILANNECLNNKLDLLIKEVESLKDMLKKKVNQTVKNNDNIPKDDNNDEGEGDTHNENVEHEV